MGTLYLMTWTVVLLELISRIENPSEVALIDQLVGTNEISEEKEWGESFFFGGLAEVDEFSKIRIHDDVFIYIICIYSPYLWI